MAEIKIRAMRLDDHAGVRSVDEATQRQYLGERWDRLSDAQKDTHLTSQASEFAMNVATGYCFVAIDSGAGSTGIIGDDCVVGFVLAYETLPYRDSLNIRYIAIHPDLQGRGVGSMLYRAVIEKAKQSKIPKITTFINLDNPESMKLHEKVGFELIDRKQAILQIW